MKGFVLFAARPKKSVEMEYVAISSKVTEKEKRQRPNALQNHLQQTSHDRKASNSLANSVGYSGGLTASWLGA